MRIIDAHNHPDWHGHDFAKFVANMDRFGIEQTWLLPWESPEDEYDHGYFAPTTVGGADGPIPFSRCLAYAEKAPERFILGYAPDPRRPGAIQKLRAAIDIYGVRVCGELKLRMMYDNPDALRMFRFCGERRLPVVVHLDYSFPTGTEYPRPDWWYGGGIETLERALRACPETVFLGHAPGFWAHISRDDKYDKEPYPKGKVVRGGKVPELMRACPNLHGDLSAGSCHNALTRDPGHAKEFLLEFQDRLLYGRDAFDNRLQEFLNGLDLPARVLRKIYSGNALSLVPDEKPRRAQGQRE